MSDTQAPLGLNDRAAMRLLGVGPTKFYQLKRSGVLESCRSPIPGLWSRVRIEAWMAQPRVMAIPWRASRRRTA